MVVEYLCPGSIVCECLDYIWPPCFCYAPVQACSVIYIGTHIVRAGELSRELDELHLKENNICNNLRSNASILTFIGAELCHH